MPRMASRWPEVLVGIVFLVAGLALIVWGADRFTDGALGVARRFAVSAFWIGAVLSGFEPENLATGMAAAMGGLPQIALGTVIGSAIFTLTAGFGVALLIVPMDVRLPRAGAWAMLAALALFALALLDGTVTRREAIVLAVAAVGVMVWLYGRSTAFRPPKEGEGDDADEPPRSMAAIVGRLALGTVAILLGAEALVSGARAVLATTGLSETFLGMTVVGLGESLEETARMVAPARRGHPELALGNIVGTLVVLVLFNLGTIALVRPLVADPLVLAFHAPYLAACAAAIATAFLVARRLGRTLGAGLVAAYVIYLAVNVAWR
jgi:cation:H+ antiporter